MDEDVDEPIVLRPDSTNTKEQLEDRVIEFPPPMGDDVVKKSSSIPLSSDERVI